MRLLAYPEFGRRITISQRRERRPGMFPSGVFGLLQGAAKARLAKMQAKSRNREHAAIRWRSWQALKWPAEPAEASMNRTGRLFARVVLSAIGALATHEANAETADDAVVCSGPHSTVAADDRIAACTRVIDSGQWRVEALGWAYLNRCLARYDKQAWDEALSDCSKAIEIDPKDANAFYGRGNAWRAKGHNDRAIADYDDAIQLDPKDANAFYGRGGAWLANGDNDRAITDYNEAIRLDPKDAYAFVGRGYAWLVKDDNDKAIADYDEAIRLDPKNAPAFVDRSIAWLGKGDNDPAIADSAEAMRIDRKDAHAFATHGLALNARGDSDGAIADYNEAIRIDPKLVGAHIDRGAAFLANGSLADAQTDFAQANAVDPKYAFAVLWLDLTERRNRLPSRLADLKTKLDMTAWPASVVRYLLGEIDLAALLAAADDPDPGKARGQLCEARFFAGELALINGDKDGAKALLRLAASECPKNFVQWPAANAELRTLGASP
jgi:lipoprotein NlpI